MWLINSSIGRKVVMSVTGIALILFLTFHGCMNLVALFSAKGYNMICEFLGANWYAVVATLGLAALAVIHIVFAFILTAQNRKARGENRYEVATTTNSNGLLDVAERWASSNMLVLGLIIAFGLIMHLKDFWYNMMFAEIFGVLGTHAPSDGFAYIVDTFSNPVISVLYLVWFCAIWFHIAHGFWSAMHTLGASGKIWQKRMQCIGLIYVSILMLCFAVVVLGFWLGFAPSLCCEGGADCCQAAAAACCN